MKHIYRAVMSVMLLLSVQTAAVADNVSYMDTEQFVSLFFDEEQTSFRYNDTLPCIIDFYTTWCGPCKMLAPVMSELSDKYAGKVRFYKMDTERERPVAAFLSINSIPQLLFVPVGGKPQMLKGFRPKEVLEAVIDEYLLEEKEY